MCNINLPNPERKEPIVLEKELTNLIGEKRANEVILLIKTKFKKALPIQTESLVFSENACFNKDGKFFTELKNNEELYNYLITFRKKTIKKGIEIDESFYYAFN